MGTAEAASSGSAVSGSDDLALVIMLVFPFLYAVGHGTIGLACAKVVL
jgi:hypothetical protein